MDRTYSTYVDNKKLYKNLERKKLHEEQILQYELH
jgi:hypothetical protein